MSIKDRLVLTSHERDTLDDLREALGLSDMEWADILATPSVTEMEQKLANYLGIERLSDPDE